MAASSGVVGYRSAELVMVVPMQTGQRTPSRREKLIAAAALAAFASFCLIDAFLSPEGGRGTPSLLLMCLAAYAGSGLSLLAAFYPGLNKPPSENENLVPRLVAATFVVVGSSAVACVGVMAALNPIVREMPARGADLWVGRVMFGGMALFLFGFSALVLVRTIAMARRRNHNSHD